MTVAAALPANPAPLELTPWTCHVVASGDLLNAGVALRTVAKVTRFKPVAHLLIDHFLALAVLVLAPLGQTRPAKLVIAVHAGDLLALFRRRHLEDLGAMRVRTVEAVLIECDLHVGFELSVLFLLCLAQKMLEVFKL